MLWNMLEVTIAVKCKSHMFSLKKITDELSLAHLIAFFTITGVNTMQVAHTKKLLNKD